MDESGEKVAMIHVRLIDTKAKRLKSLARKEDRSVAQVIRDLVNQYLKEHGESLLVVTWIISIILP